MKKIKILPIIIHFNQPDEAQAIYEKFKRDGFEDVILCDNGSDKTLPAKNTNFHVKKNNFFRDGITRAFEYAEKNYDFDYVFHTSTSLFYDENINYKKSLEDAIADAEKRKLKLGLLEFYDVNALKTHNKHFLNIDSGTSVISFGEGTHCCIKKELYLLLKENKKAYFNELFVKGWGIDYELYYTALKNDYVCLRLNDAKLKRDSLTPYKKGLRTENIENYQKSARLPMEDYIKDNFGSVDNLIWAIDILYREIIRKNKNKIKGLSYKFRYSFWKKLIKRFKL